ncbi:MAG: hypothetical protein F4118_11245 [Acidimicrobiaceae bacterium]|nr:hypothetical protein [Acidimicrobiaceae bacterium]MYI36982.1 hypothetical protein [Acidimicrobiaceae bacterium]
MSITDQLAAAGELADLLSSPDADSRICALLIEQVNTAVGQQMLKVMVDEWAQERYLGSLCLLRERAWDGHDDGELWPVTLRMLAGLGLTVGATAADGIVGVMQPTKQAPSPHPDPLWVCIACRTANPMWLETTDNDGIVMEMCSVCLTPDTRVDLYPMSPREPILLSEPEPTTQQQSLF